jgi:hypothetical protein
MLEKGHRLEKDHSLEEESHIARSPPPPRRPALKFLWPQLLMRARFIVYLP